MKKEVVQLVPYSCDCCGAIFGDIDTTTYEFIEIGKIGSYTLYGSGGITFEGYLDGDYCTECMAKIKDDIFKNGYLNSAMRDRYDKVNLELEISKVKKIVRGE